ncbi:hypothetical protein MA9V2_075 [Chryseobacterium phage MA9V-2]|nr:hypothetical protein MA9V2_075 [Chryseobacterium phage MA9V-2]
MNIQNLKRTIELVNTLDAEDLHMEYYRNDTDLTQKCGSAGCILGHATILDSEENWKKFLDNDGSDDFDFFNWSLSFYDIPESKSPLSPDFTWAYMFNSAWGYSNAYVYNELAEAVTDEQLTAICKILSSPKHAVYRMQKIVDGYQPKSFTEEYADELSIVTAYVLAHDSLENIY